MWSVAVLVEMLRSIAHVMYSFLIVVSQCYKDVGCGGDIIEDIFDRKDCCVGTNDGLSYSDPASTMCTDCVGKKVYQNLC